MARFGTRYRKRRAVKRKQYRRKAYNRPRGRGAITVRRLMHPLGTVASGAGTIVVQTGAPGGQNCLTLGTPVAEIVGQSVFAIPFAMKFRIDDLVNVADFTNMFDQYCIKSAMVNIRAPDVNGVAIPNPFIQYVRDTDDGVLPSVSTFREKMGTKTVYSNTAGRPLTLRCANPKYRQTALATLSPGVVNAYSIPKGVQWVNSSYPDVEHFGIKGILRNVYLNAATSFPWTWDVSLTVGLKDVQ